MTTIKKALSEGMKRATKLQADLRKAKKALKLADSVMSYCQGDRWERECTSDDRKEFAKLYEEVMGEGSSV